MNYESSIQEQIANASSLAEDAPENEVTQIVSESVNVDVDYPIALMTESHSIKPTNIQVELDVFSVFEAMSQVGIFSEDPILKMGALAGLCSIVGRRTKIDIEPEVAFVYWVAYENRHEKWEIPKQELEDHVMEMKEEVERPLQIDEDDFEDVIYKLRKYRCISTENGGDTIVLRETCSADWS